MTPLRNEVKTLSAKIESLMEVNGDLEKKEEKWREEAKAATAELYEKAAAFRTHE